MRMLVNREYTGDQLPFSLFELKTHLRVDHDDEDLAIQNIGLAAAADVESFAQIALLSQLIRVNIFEPAIGCHGIKLPIGPVLDAASVAITVDGEAFTGFEVATGGRPFVTWKASYADLVPSRLGIEYTAGFGAAASNIPADLRLAIMDQAAAIYDGRSPSDAKTLATSPHMARIGARYRGVSVS